MSIPQEVLELLEPLVKQFEGLRLAAYQDSTGRWTIGYGHTGPDVVQGLVWTQGQANAQLALDLGHAYSQMSSLLPDILQLNSSRQTALADFVYNLGVGTLAHSSLLPLVIRGEWPAVKTQLALWCHAGGKVLPGLVKRRQAEIDLIDA